MPVDNAIYAVGHRLARPVSLGTTVEELQAEAQGQDVFCWVGDLRPDARLGYTTPLGNWGLQVTLRLG